MSTRILCVHDRADELKRLRGALEEAGYEVVPATNGAEALHFLRMNTVQGAVLDYNAQAPGGVSLRNRIRHYFPEMPMLMFSDIAEIEHIPLDMFRAYLEDPAPPAALFTHA